MTLSSIGERPRVFSGSAYSESSDRNSSRSKSSGITPLLVEAEECRRTFSHLPFPWVLSGRRRDSATLLFEFERPYCQCFSFIGRQGCALGRDSRCNMPQAFLAHGLSQDCVSLTERIDAVNQVNIEFANIHREPSHTRNQCRVRCRLIATAPGVLLRLLGKIERGNSVLANGLLVF